MEWTFNEDEPEADIISLDVTAKEKMSVVCAAKM